MFPTGFLWGGAVAANQVEECGGKLIKPKFTIGEMTQAVIEDSEGNGLYLWETPSTVTWDEPESQTIRIKQRIFGMVLDLCIKRDHAEFCVNLREGVR